MPSTRLVYRSSLLILWALLLWHAWECRGLFIDGAKLIYDVVQQQDWIVFRRARFYMEVLRQLPLNLAVHAGITDLHLLSQVLSFGLGLPATVFYTVALFRARNEPVLLAAVIAVIAACFMTTSFFIAGEYNATFAMTMAAAVWLATTDRLRAVEGLGLLAIAFVFSRSYEVTLYHGPVLALMTLWRIATVQDRPRGAMLLYLLAAVFFLGGAVVALDSLIHPYDAEYQRDVYNRATDFWQNPQFDVIFAAILVVVVWTLVRPSALLGRKPYFWASMVLAILALSPLMALTDTTVFRPLARAQFPARTACGAVVIAVVVFVWLYSADFHRLVQPLVLLHRADVAPRFLAFAWLMLLATLPSDLFLTRAWSNYLDVLRATVRSHSGVVALEDTKLAQFPTSLMVENWIMPVQSLVVRSKPGDAIVAPARSFDGWVPFPPARPPDFGKFFWRD